MPEDINIKMIKTVVHGLGGKSRCLDPHPPHKFSFK